MKLPGNIICCMKKRKKNKKPATSKNNSVGNAQNLTSTDQKKPVPQVNENKKINKIKKQPIESEPTETEDSKSLTLRFGLFLKKYQHVFNIILILLITLIGMWLTDYFGAEKVSVSKLFGLLPSKPSIVATVEINDDDYREYFNSVSPLGIHNEKLNEILMAILESQPKIVGVALDTSDSSFADFKPPTSSIPIIWGETPVLKKDGELDHILAPLGGQTLDQTLEGLSGVFQDTETNALCCYQRSVAIAKGVYEETLAQKLLDIYNQSLESKTESDEQYYFKLKGEEQDNQRTALTVGHLLKMSQNADWQTNNPLKDKIVILAGSFIGQEKIFPTYNGYHKGYELYAASIETEMDGVHLQPSPWHLRTLLMFVFFILGVIIFHVFEKQFFIAIIISISVFLVLSFLLSLYRYGNIYGIFQYLPALLYMLIGKVSEYLYYKDSLVNYLFSLFRMPAPSKGN